MDVRIKENWDKGTLIKEGKKVKEGDIKKSLIKSVRKVTKTLKSTKIALNKIITKISHIIARCWSCQNIIIKKGLNMNFNI